MLLALACGVAIMLAGAVFLFQLAGQDELAAPVPVGEETRVGDMSVTVVESAESAGILDVVVEIGGVDDADGATGFRLIASGRPVGQESVPDGRGCSATVLTEQQCIVRFDVGLSDGTSRVLFYERGDDQARWVLG